MQINITDKLKSVRHPSLLAAYKKNMWSKGESGKLNPPVLSSLFLACFLYKITHLTLFMKWLFSFYWLPFSLYHFCALHICLINSDSCISCTWRLVPCVLTKELHSHFSCHAELGHMQWTKKQQYHDCSTLICIFRKMILLVWVKGPLPFAHLLS